MLAGTLERQSLDRQRFEDYERYRRERRRTDEITEASEKLAAPMLNSFEYELGADGQLYFQGESIEEVFMTGVKVAEELVKTQPQFSVELLRRYIELDEYRAMQRLALGSEDEPDILVTISPMPDAVLNGVDLGAYDLERRVTMLRVFERTESGIRASSLSLDRSDRDGLRVIARTFDEDIGDADTSEDILAKRMWGWRKDLSGEEPAAELRKSYDRVLHDKYGGDWLGGRLDPAITDARRFIETQAADLLEQHELVLDLIERDGGDIKRARYDFAAALSRRMRGETDTGTLSDAGDAARASGETFRDNCPTGMAASETTAALGIGWREFKPGTCRACLYDKPVGECGVCLSCEAADNMGVDLNEVNRQAKRRVAAKQSIKTRQNQETNKEVKKPASKKENQVVRKYGRYAMLGIERMAFGGKEQEVLDIRSGQVIGRVSV